MQIIRKWLDFILEFICCSLLFIMVVIACWQVISRYIVGEPSTFSEEFLRFALVWLSLLGMAYVVGKQEHVSLTVLVDKLPKRVICYWMFILQFVFMVFAFLILIKGGIKASENAMFQISPVLQLSMGKVYYAVPISGFLIIVYSLLNAGDLLKQILQKEFNQESTLDDIYLNEIEKQGERL